MILQSPSQTVGPYYRIGMIYGTQNVLVNDETKGQRITITGRLLDGDRQPILDGCLEIWQADANGYHNHPADPNQDKADKNFRGWGRAHCEDNGRFVIQTIKPGPVMNTDGTLLAPHVNIHVFGRGMLIHARTRFFFSDEADANANDPILKLVDESRRDTMIMQLADDSGLTAYHLDVKFQGDDETVFFDIFQ